MRVCLGWTILHHRPYWPEAQIFRILICHSLVRHQEEYSAVLIVYTDSGNVFYNLKASIAPELGDFDGDGDVDGVDIAEMFSNFNGPGGGVPTNPETDLDSDGDVDGVDITQLFGAFTGPLAPANVPEPTSLGLLALGSLAITRRRR